MKSKKILPFFLKKIVKKRKNIVYNGHLLDQTGKTEKENRFSAVAGNRL